MMGPHSRRSHIQIGAHEREAKGYSASADPEFVHDARKHLANRGIRAPHAILLVHGWRVGAGREADSYDALLANIGAYDPEIELAVLSIAWPSRGAYWTIAPTVRRVARALARKFVDPTSALYGTEQLVMVAHSMGCAFALELCRALIKCRTLKDPPRIRLFLMAAAVPVSRLSDTGGLRCVAERSQRTCVYHSRADQAFGPVFRFGEWWTNGTRNAEAVGEYGRPDALWSDPVSMEMFTHGDYWRSPDIARDIVEEIGSPARRTLPRRRF